MYQLPVNNLTRIRRARKKVKWALQDIGLEFCKEAAEDFKEFCPDEETVNDSFGLDICSWDPSYSKTQQYRSKTFCCTECSFSSKYYSGYKNHFRNVHRKLLDSNILLHCPYCTFMANKRTLETHVKMFHINNVAPAAQGAMFAKKMNPENAKAVQGIEKVIYFCKKCTYRDPLYNVVRKHIYREHFQHIVAPYLSMTRQVEVKQKGRSVTNKIIFCKQCQFCSRSYEALVQHVLDYHERIGSQVTAMIGLANMVVSTPPPLPVLNHKASPVFHNSQTLRTQLTTQPAVGYPKPSPPVVKNLPSLATSEKRVTAPSNSTLTESNASGVNTAQTQKWKICTVCNELFPENLYSAHFESAHKAKKVWTLAKYIMKIHNFTSKCLLCNRYLPSDTLLNHLLIHGLTCPQCHSSFHSVEKIIEHVSLIHTEEYVGPPGASPLTFDLTFKQGKIRNVQLAVLTFNMKETVNGENQAAPVRNSVTLPVKPLPNSMTDKQREQAAYTKLMHSNEVGKTVCPLCFSVLRGPISESLSMHLRERHQVIQTLHPVEKKMTYKCIHCLGVYTSNMVASTITLHLVQCRGVGRNQGTQGYEPTLTVNSSGASVLKRPLLVHGGPAPKRGRPSKQPNLSVSPWQCKPEFNGLVLDPRGYEHKTVKERKDFLTAYFNRRPYPTSEEHEKLSASLSLWESDIADHFTSTQRMCEKNCLTTRVSIQFGFDMHAVKRLKHNLIFDHGKLVGISTKRSSGLTPRGQIFRQNKPQRPISALKPSICTETISIDSDSDPEEIPTKNEPKGPVQTEHLPSEEQQHVIEETKPPETGEHQGEQSISQEETKHDAGIENCLHDDKEEPHLDENSVQHEQEKKDESSLSDAKEIGGSSGSLLQDIGETVLQENEKEDPGNSELPLKDDKESDGNHEYSLQDENVDIIETLLEVEKNNTESSLQDGIGIDGMDETFLEGGKENDGEKESST